MLFLQRIFAPTNRQYYIHINDIWYPTLMTLMKIHRCNLYICFFRNVLTTCIFLLFSFFLFFLVVFVLSNSILNYDYKTFPFRYLHCFVGLQFVRVSHWFKIIYSDRGNQKNKNKKLSVLSALLNIVLLYRILCSFLLLKFCWFFYFSVLSYLFSLIL